MIYHPHTKTRVATLVPSGAGGFVISIDTDMVSSLEGITADPSAIAERLVRISPHWVQKQSVARRTIKYTRMEDSISRQIRQLNQQISVHVNAQRIAYRSKKNAAMRLIRQSCEVNVPVFKYVRTWKVRDVTYIKKVKLRINDALHYENSGTEIRFDTAEYSRLLRQAESVGPFDKTRTVRIIVSKTFGYWANVKTFVRNRKVIKDRETYDKRRADWVNQNPPYRSSEDSFLASLRQQVINLKMKAATEYNQCLAVSTGGACGTPSECWEAAYTMLAQYLLPTGILSKGHWVLDSDLGHYQQGYCIRVERLAAGDPTTGQLPSWFDVYDYTEEWQKPEITFEVRDSITNREYGQSIGDPYANSALHLIGGREFKTATLGLGYNLRAAYDRAALNLAAGGGNPLQWNFARSFAELKDTPKTVATAREFLQHLAKGRLKAATTVGMAARLYLTYKFGLAPTADDVGTLLGASKALLKNTYPLLRTLKAYADGAATVSITGRQVVSLDAQSIVNGIFPTMWEQDLDLGDLHVNSIYANGSWRTTIAATNYGLFAKAGDQVSGVEKTLPDKVWNQLERGGVAPRWVWLPEKPLVFCKYDAGKVRDSLGTSFINVLDSLDIITTMWELTPLSFVVDWFTNLISAFAAMDDFVHAAQLDLRPDGEGPWHSTRFRLYLAVPIYRKKGGTRDFTTWYTDLEEETVTEHSGTGAATRGTFVRPLGVHVQVRAPRVGVTLLKTDTFAYARDLMEGAPLLALLPDIKVSLNAGKLSSLLAILLSSGR